MRNFAPKRMTVRTGQQRKPKGRRQLASEPLDFVTVSKIAADAANMVDASILRLPGPDRDAELKRLALHQRFASRRQLVEQVAHAYAWSESFRTQLPIVDEFMVSPAGRKEPERHAVELLIDYSDSKRTIVAVQKLYSRDAAAIRYLRSAGILPSKVAELSEKKGEGLDEWSRRAAKRKPPVTTQPRGKTRTHLLDLGPRTIRLQIDGKLDGETFVILSPNIEAVRQALQLVSQVKPGEAMTLYVRPRKRRRSDREAA